MYGHLAAFMDHSGKLRALLATARIANVPSVVSNVWLGVMIGVIIGRVRLSEALWPMAGSLALAGVLLYVGGNFLNDWMDRGWDRLHRPERALPGKLFRPGAYLTAALVLMMAGVALAAAGGWRSASVAGGIVGCIVIYTIFHKQTPWAVVPMGLCRGLLPVMGFEAFYPYLDGVWPAACGLLCYIAGLSLSARYESLAEPPRLTGLLARLLLLTTAVLMAWGNHGMALARLPVILGALPYLAWTSYCLRFRRRPVPRLVSGLLAGIPLVDCMVLLPASMMMISESNGNVTLIAATCLLVPPIAFLLALVLQRLAPAT